MFWWCVHVCILGEYIVLYQTQRESLKKKFEQKDNFITQLIQDKETLQVYACYLVDKDYETSWSFTIVIQLHCQWFVHLDAHGVLYLKSHWVLFLWGV